MLKMQTTCSLEPRHESATPLVEWEDVDCLLCASQRRSILVEAPDPTSEATPKIFSVVQCQECGLCYTNPRPTPETIGPYYSQQYRPHQKRRQRRRRLFGWRLAKQAEHEAVPWHGKGRLLDFGCGGGRFLEHMRAQGWQVTGVDTSVAAVERIRADSGLDVVVGSLPHPEFCDGSYDVITMWHSLEHVHRPLEALRVAYDLLAPGGRLVVGVPNIDSLPFRWFGADWFGLDLPRHLTHFTPATLQLMLERAGFGVTSLKLIRHSDWLRASARLACRHGAATWRQRCCRSKPISSVVTRYAYFTGATDCIHVTAQKDGG